MNRFYVIDETIILDFYAFKAFLINYIHKHELYDLRNLLGGGKASVERHVNHHPFRLAKEIFGADRVITYVE